MESRECMERGLTPPPLFFVYLSLDCPPNTGGVPKPSVRRGEDKILKTRTVPLAKTFHGCRFFKRVLIRQMKSAGKRSVIFVEKLSVFAFDQCNCPRAKHGSIGIRQRLQAGGTVERVTNEINLIEL